MNALEVLSRMVAANLASISPASMMEGAPTLTDLSRTDLASYVAHGSEQLLVNMSALLHGLREMERRGWTLNLERGGVDH